MTFDELNRVRALREQLAAEIRRLETLRLSAASLCRQLDGLPRSTPLTSTPERLAAAIVDSEQKISELTAAIDESATELSAEIYSTISDNLIATVLVMNFCAGVSTGEIARRLNYTRNYIWKVRRRGIKILTAGAA